MELQWDILMPILTIRYLLIAKMACFQYLFATCSPLLPYLEGTEKVSEFCIALQELLYPVQLVNGEQICLAKQTDLAHFFAVFEKKS